MDKHDFNNGSGPAGREAVQGSTARLGAPIRRPIRVSARDLAPGDLIRFDRPGVIHL